MHTQFKNKIGLLFTFVFLGHTFLFGQPNVYDIYALEYRRGDWNPLVSEIAVGASAKDTLEGNFAIWLLQNKNGKHILVDAGFDTQKPDGGYVRPDSVLQKLNLQPGDITDIILTHPHWDHMGGIHLFPNAMVWMQEDDFNYFVGKAWQQHGFSDGFDKNDVPKLIQKNLDGKLTLVKGDSIEIMPGIRVFIGSKHTWESQYVLVNGTSGNTIIASDNIWFYANLEYLLPIPHYTFDPDGYVTQMKRMKTLVADSRLIIPGHDAVVFDNFPRVTDGVVKIELKKE
jgi:glyoxylase-like metal-dependent hydrolase (beta-lactamase superfamily II)